jgi:hypothetical protein
VIEKKLEAGLEEEPHPFSVTRIKGRDEYRFFDVSGTVSQGFIRARPPFHTTMGGSSLNLPIIKLQDCWSISLTSRGRLLILCHLSKRHKTPLAMSIHP